MVGSRVWVGAGVGGNKVMVLVGETGTAGWLAQAASMTNINASVSFFIVRDNLGMGQSYPKIKLETFKPWQGHEGLWDDGGGYYNSSTMQPTKQPLQIAGRVMVILALALVFTGWLVTTPPGFLGKLDSVGYAVCHRISERSFHIGSYQLPLCARCSGMYLGAMLGLAFQAVTSRRKSGMPGWLVIIPLALFFLAFAVDGGNSYLYLIKETYPGALASIPNLYIPNNTLRLFTGSGMGLVISAAIFPAFNQTIWKRQDDRPALVGLQKLALLVAITLLADLLVLTESPWVLFPLALISAGGVLVLLTMIYAILWLMLFKQDNLYERLSQAWLALLAGFTLSLLQVAVVDVLRFWLTHTWGGFPLG